MSDPICVDFVKGTVTLNIRKAFINPDGSIGRLILTQEGNSIELTFVQAKSWISYIKDIVNASNNT